MMYLFFQSLAPTIPASFLTFGDHPLYKVYETFPRIWGISVLTDQLIAGLIMKLIGGAILWVVIGAIFFRWYGREQRSRARSTQYPGARPRDPGGAEPMSEPQEPQQGQAPEAPEAEHPERENRQSLLLPILFPVGDLAHHRAGAASGSRACCWRTRHAATVVALITACGHHRGGLPGGLARAAHGAALLPMIGAIFGIALLAGGVALVARRVEKTGTDGAAHRASR